LLEDPGKRNAFARVARERVEQQFSVVAETGKLQQLFIASLDGN